MDKVYDHKKYEADIYKAWETSGAFTPKVDKKQKPFCLIMSPPNANDPLHIGYAREMSTQDILVRYHRMRGEPTLWLPGADHAGIETQYVFEKRLKEKGKSRFDYDRETLYQMIWDYVAQNKHIMENQLRQLGASCDWTRNKFTLDPDIVKVVYQTFKKLYDEGFVYRGERIVNYCPRCGTSFSELEVDHVEREDEIYYLDYGVVTIATTRPETIFADVAVAVNPKDSKNKRLIGKKAIIPLINREIEIIGDSLVDPKFGTGALKITPGHDPVDFEIGQKHKLPIISVVDENGKLTNTPQQYTGLSTAVAREKVVNDIEDTGKLVKVEKIKHVVGVCYRDKGLIEPIVSKQWFIKVEALAKKALTAIKNKNVRFEAIKFEKIATHWLKNLKDWNISRQIVWGIRIPAWRCDKCLEWTVSGGAPPAECPMCGNKKLTQDADTFDTWFSSGQWPFATLKTNKPGDFDYFYPTAIINPAYDILPFWVIRMIMLGLFATNKVPFETVLLHGLVRDKHGVKISKSKGNVINPIEVAKKYGADALRVALIWGSLVENDSSLSEENIKGQRNFANKIWNISRFVLMNKSETLSTKPKILKRPRAKTEEDKKILEGLKKATTKITNALEKYRLNEAAEKLYDFIWNDFANKYLESTKTRRNEAQPILEYVLATSLKLAHPFMPFVTEVIWSTSFARDTKDLLITSNWPEKH
ncbi:valine--tRNA ligase [Candidatus Woesebacteria bacterium RIFCSPHIGHO2_01_FULL_44_10]|uniref:Valine--tRNA ligase n=1 Tax=Candidatus Woesebacteria bacterium RIFCSPLOWO2_01_FULL_44_14 TaxID=1802525 RepID=A0A1F8C1E7_9BACT|nr:MAG: valine--tRNA ligase [Candidatus Woesebacteria bacterium RIFCSPHIGHO2_01_FULL_44_10]OGM53725.1 MAG: valine--tRNA ligase [Candidatus Woesebacteria bacterium RIFCSPHIGHO2_12_FULL_44_11]OGM70072.1 MAG: valine--tRNA ligase [Candidatus Woesebacteria bacterium RIFCSPLOWO2_01_FULL_44_14]